MNTTLSTAIKPVVKVIEKDHSLIISSSSSTAILCTVCGGRKAVVSYIDAHKHLIYAGERTCRCTYAPNPGGDIALPMSEQEHEQQRLLSDLYERPTIEEIRLTIPLTPAREKYAPDFQEMLHHLSTCKDLKSARSVMERYSINRFQSARVAS